MPQWQPAEIFGARGGKSFCPLLARGRLRLFARRRHSRLAFNQIGVGAGVYRPPKEGQPKLQVSSRLKTSSRKRVYLTCQQHAQWGPISRLWSRFATSLARLWPASVQPHFSQKMKIPRNKGFPVTANLQARHSYLLACWLQIVDSSRWSDNVGSPQGSRTILLSVTGGK